MFKKQRAINAEVQAARKERDELQQQAAVATKAADRVIDELLNGYEQADKQRERNGGR